jgi:hypothetical protein
MAIRLSGELPIQEIAAEFGGEAAPNPLSDYYADGVFLSKGYAPNPPAIPNTGSALNIGAFYGKGKKVPITITITANEANVNMFTKFKNSGLMSSYANVDISATLVINSGVTVYGSGIGANAALTVPATDATRTNGFKPTDDIIIQNNGNIVGYYGTGGLGGTGNVAGSAGTNGGVGVLLNAKTRIINNGTIAGGAKGGDGGSGGITVTPVETFCQLYTTTQQPQTTYKCGGKTSYVTASQAQKSTMECNKVCSPCNGAHSIAGRVQTCGCPQNQAQTSYTPVTKAMGYGSCTQNNILTLIRIQQEVEVGMALQYLAILLLLEALEVVVLIQ